MQRKRLLYASAVFFCIGVFAALASTHGTLLSEMIAHYNLSESKQGFANSAQHIGSVVALIGSLFIIGRASKQNILWIFMLLMLIPLIPLGMLPSFPVVVAMFAVIGIACGMLDTVASSIVADLYRGDPGAARMMCALHGTFSIFSVLFPQLYSWLLNGGRMEWNQIYWAIAIVGGIGTLGFLLPIMPRWIRETPKNEQPQRISPALVKDFFRSRNRLLLALVSMFYGVFLGGITVWVNRYIRVDLARPDLGVLALSLFWLGNAVSRLLIPNLRISPVRYIRVTMLLTGIVLLPGILSGNAVFLCVTVIVSSFLSGAVIPMAVHLACEQFSENSMLASTIMLLFLYIAQSLCAPVIGSMEAVFGLKAGLTLCPIFALGGGVASLWIKRD